jgi:FkbM family methyltransferase
MSIARFIFLFSRSVINWPMYMLNFVMPVTYRLWGGGTIRIRPTDRCAFNDVFIFRHYDAPIPWDTVQKVVDIGANIGAYTLFAQKKANKAAITAVEPDPDNFELLKRNAPAGITCIKAAVGGEQKQVVLHKAEKAGEHSLYGSGEGIAVDMITLHQFLPCDVLKLDCEGAEYEIFRSLSDEELRTIRFILIELHTVEGESRDALKERLMKAGFRLTEQVKSVYFCEKMDA